MKRLVLAWLRWRYGGNVWALKPPLGWWSPNGRRPLWQRIIYRAQVVRYNIECMLFNRYGHEMREKWSRHWCGREL
jgi:hypothetical protein